MESLSAFFAMGGYAGYIWPAYGLALVVMVAVLVLSFRDARARETELDLLQQARGRRRPSAGESK
ncbi:MAG: heme exporter protein CcmD [Magnetospirillum sp.]|nr:heme exporter protein CcmD [Magnetospirillum sp.]